MKKPLIKPYFYSNEGFREASAADATHHNLACIHQVLVKILEKLEKLEPKGD